jgi:DNA polymerase-3 subunit alpha
MITNIELLKKLVYNGARSKKLPLTDIVLDRLSYELSIIEKQNFCDYFITYSRIIEVCNELNLLRSYNRGSAANSIVNYCLDITKIILLKRI